MQTRKIHRAIIDSLESRRLLSASLVKDIHLTTASAQNDYGNQEITASGGNIYFRADDGVHGPQLWMFPQPATSTVKPAPVMVSDIVDPTNNGPTNLTDVNGTLFFTDNDSVHGTELWKTNGTLAGTSLVKDINPGSSSSNPANLTNVNGTLYFSGYSSGNNDLFESDGTAAGTVVVQSFGSTYPYGPVAPFTSTGSQLLFRVYSSYGYYTYISDGTSAGTHPLVDSSNQSLGMLTTPFVVANGKGFIGASSLYVTDGTSAGTSLIDNVSVDSLVPFQNEAFFTGEDSSGLLALFKSDGTAAGTSEVKTLGQGAYTSANNLTVVGNTLLFEADGQNSGFQAEYQLWQSDGTAAGTSPIAQVAGPVNNHPHEVVVAGSTGYFIGIDNQLWSTDGTSAPAPVTSLTPGLKNQAEVGGVTTDSLLGTANGEVYFSADDGTHGIELWQSDGTTVGTSLIADINQNTLNSYPRDGVLFNGMSFFSADDGIHGRGLWATDGTAAGTTLIYSSTPSSTDPNGLDPTNFCVLGNTLYFSGHSTGAGYTLWQSDGTTAGTHVTDLSPVTISTPTDLTRVGNLLYFKAASGSTVGIFRTDGTGAGTVQLLSFPYNNETYSPQITAVGQKAFFELEESATQFTLYSSDGTVAGTTLFDSIPIQTSVSTNGINNATLISFNGAAYFTTSDITNGNNLWRSDGTVAGTTLVKYISPGNSGLPPYDMVVAGGTLFFAADDMTNGTELWKSDGTTAGTSVVKDANPGPAGSNPNWITAFGNKVVYAAMLSTGGYAPWVSDGTAAGTFALSVRASADNPGSFSAAGKSVYFSNSDATFGDELWSTDGTVAGTGIAADINPGVANSTPHDIIALPSGTILFGATDPTHGDELWSYTAPVIVPGSISGSVYSNNVGLSGVTLVLQAQNSSSGQLVLQTTTRADGAYGFINVPAGSYTIQQLLPSGYLQISPANNGVISVTVTNGTVLSGQNFTDEPLVLGTVTGSVTANGSGLSGVKVFLDANNNNVLDPGELSTTTSSGGTYSFSNVSLGSYVIRQILPSGYAQTSPANSSGIAIAVKNGAMYANQNFTDAPINTIKQLTGTTIGTAGSYKNLGTTIAKATDGNLATYFDGPTASGDWVGIDLGSSGGVVTQIKFASRTGWASRMNGGIFQASNSASFSSGVVNLYTIGSNANPPSGSLTTVNISNKTAYRYYRYLAPANSYGDVAEVQFFGTPGGLTPPPAKLSGKTIGTTGSYANGGNTITKATDGNLSTYFDGPTANGDWVGLDLGSSKTIRQIAFAPRSGWASRMTGGKIQISTTANFSSGVTTIYTISTAPATGKLTFITLTKAVTARYVRYLSPNGGYGDISEFEVLG